MGSSIVACLDGSKAAEGILPLVTEEALAHRSPVVLARVVSLPEIVVPISLPGEPGIPMATEGAARRTRVEESEAQAYLERVAGPMRGKGIDVKCVVLPGIAGETILEYARENGAGLIAVSTHGHGGIRRLVIGSTADYILHRSTLPVLVVRPPGK